MENRKPTSVEESESSVSIIRRDLSKSGNILKGMGLRYIEEGIAEKQSVKKRQKKE